MTIKMIRSDEIYRKMIAAQDGEKRENIYRYELMEPFAFKWQCIGIPLKAEHAGENDVVTASMASGGYHPRQITKERLPEVEKISEDSFWVECKESIRRTLEGFPRHGISLPRKDYVFTILLNNPKNPMTTMTGDYCGDGGIPGYIIGTIVPNENSLRMLPVALAHETDHNVRWQFQKWGSGITLADLMVSEGLAETMAAHLFGEDKIGMWVKNTPEEVLQRVIKPGIKENLGEKNFNKILSYLYGDKIMAMRGGVSVGMPYCAGYACGYWLVKHYLWKTGQNIYAATVAPTETILRETEDFWN